MRVVFVTTEAEPFAKTGGLADVSGALPPALMDLGVHIDVIMPLYGTIDTSAFGLKKLIIPQEMKVPVGGQTEGLGIWQGTIPGSTVQVYFLEHQWYFDRSSLYTDPATGSDYEDNAARFVYFCRAALVATEALNLRPDVFHCNDYQTALIPAYLKHSDSYGSVLGNAASLYSIHNMAYQGLYPRSAMLLTGIGFEHFYPMSPFEFHGRVNLMKAGIVFADEISTVSERYALEIRSYPEYGHGLEGVLSERRADLSGIVNGIDDVSWNPGTDLLIPAHFSADDLAGKRLNKQSLLKTFGFSDGHVDTPLIGMVSRLVSQKGLDLVTEALDPLADLDVRFVFLGTGDAIYHRALQQAAALYPDRIAVHLAFDNRLAHQIVAGSDMFLMPSQYEPCGLSQLYSLRYGTIPIVRGTGGLVDTVQDIEGDSDGGTGFVFHDYTSDAMLVAIERALDAYDARSMWEEIMRRGMAKDFSWRKSAEKYQVLYQRAIDHRR